MKTPKSLLNLVFGIATVFALTSASAQVILIDFGPAGNPTASPDANNNYWNNQFSAASGGLTDLKTTTNLSSNINFTISSGFIANGPSENPPSLVGTASLGALNVSTALSDFFFVNNSTATITFSGLDLTKTYTFQLLGSRDASGTPADRNTTYTITGANSDFETLKTTGINLGGTGINYNNSNLAVISSIVPNATTSSITLDVSSAGLGYLNAVQINVIPEPTTLALVAVVGLLGVVGSRRRRVA